MRALAASSACNVRAHPNWRCYCCRCQHHLCRRTWCNCCRLMLRHEMRCREAGRELRQAPLAVPCCPPRRLLPDHQLWRLVQLPCTRAPAAVRQRWGGVPGCRQSRLTNPGVLPRCFGRCARRACLSAWPPCLGRPPAQPHECVPAFAAACLPQAVQSAAHMRPATWHRRLPGEVPLGVGACCAWQHRPGSPGAGTWPCRRSCSHLVVARSPPTHHHHHHTLACALSRMRSLQFTCF